MGHILFVAQSQACQFHAYILSHFHLLATNLLAKNTKFTETRHMQKKQLKAFFCSGPTILVVESFQFLVASAPPLPPIPFSSKVIEHQKVPIPFL